MTAPNEITIKKVKIFLSSGRPPCVTRCAARTDKIGNKSKAASFYAGNKDTSLTAVTHIRRNTLFTERVGHE